MTSRAALLIGHFGGGNAGDEAILDGTCHLFAEAGVDRVRVVARGDAYQPRTTAPVSIEVVATSAVAVLQAVWHASSVVLGGGTHFDDRFEGRRRLRHYRYLVRYLAVLLLARVLGRPVVALGQGFGPLPTRTGRGLTRALFMIVHNGTVRDDASLVWARRLGCGPGWTRTFDSAAAAPAHWREPDWRPAKLAIAPVFGTAPDGLWPSCATAIAIAYEHGDVEAVDVDALRGGDREADTAPTAELMTAIGRTVPSIVTSFDGRVEPLVDAFGSARVVLCGRYHALVLALLAGSVPIVLPAHPKLHDAATLVGLPPALIVRHASAESIVRAIEAAIDLDARKLRPALEDLRPARADVLSLLAAAEERS
jgi:polysaccharide pyruvyl transferase WcaK-like protein